jgi:peptidoglycan hydrolase CwlO-like protein
MNNKDFDHHIDSTNLQEKVESLQKDAKLTQQEVKELQDKNDMLVQKLSMAQQEINK